MAFTCAGCGLEEKKKRDSQVKLYEHCEKCRLVPCCLETCQDGDLVSCRGKWISPFLTTTGEPLEKEDGDGGRSRSKTKDTTSSLSGKLERVKIDDDQPVTDSSDSDFVPKPNRKAKTYRSLKKPLVGTNGYDTDSSTRSNAATDENKSQSSVSESEKGYFDGMTRYGVFRQLVDCFRLFLNDEQERISESTNSVAAFPNFNIFLDRAEAVSGLLPTWWNNAQREICMDVGRERTGDPDIFTPVTEGDLIEDYGGDLLMPSMLRGLAHQISGREDS